MKTLIESIFDDNLAESFSFNEIIQNLWPNEGSDKVVRNLDYLYGIGNEYELSHANNKLKRDLKKGDYILMYKNQFLDYELGWIWTNKHGVDAWFDRVYYDSDDNRWYTDHQMDFYFGLRSEMGIEDLVKRLEVASKGTDKCSLITNKKLVDAIKKELEKIVG